MNNYEFLDLFLGSMNNYWLSLFIVVLIYFFLYKKFYVSLLDPFFLSIFGSCMGFSVVLFLFIENEISFYYFSNYLLTQFGFIFAFRFVVGKKIIFKTAKTNMNGSRSYIKCMFMVSSAIYVLSQLYVYKQVGIPLFMESRLEVFVGGSGFGLFSRFISVSKIISLFIVMDILFHKNKYSMFYSVSSCGVILFFIMAAFLSGSKGEFITIGYILFIYVTLNPLSRIKHKPAFLFLKKNEKKIILAGFLLAILTISTKSDEKSYIESLALLGFRILRFGDVYFYAYPNGYIENLNGSSSFYALFKDFLGLIRIVSWENLPQTLGIDLYLMHHYTDTIEGPNARHNVFGYVHFGYYGSIIFSIIIGSLVGFVRSLIFNAQNYSFLLKIILMVIFANIYVMETDPVYGLSLVNSVIIVMPVIFLLSTLLYAAYKSVQINGITNSNPQYN